MKRYRRALGILFLLSTSGVFAAMGQVNSEQTDTKGIEPTLWPRDTRYLLQIGDTVEIAFRFTPEFNQTVTIQPDGFINLRDLPDLRAAGRSTPELTQMLETAYARILHDPVITLQLKDFEKPYFVAGGQLERPGKYDLRGTTTVIQAVVIAGGFKPNSKHSQVLLYHRISDEWTEVTKLDLKKMLKSGDLREDPHLRPGDLIFVPQNTISKIQRYIPSMSMGAYLPR